jgi:thiol:disulfide interchange protein
MVFSFLLLNLPEWLLQIHLEDAVLTALLLIVVCCFVAMPRLRIA